MGEYGAYVWPAYGIAALLFIGLIIDSVHRRRTNLKRLDQMKAMRGDRRRREPPAASAPENPSVGAPQKAEGEPLS